MWLGSSTTFVAAVLPAIKNQTEGEKRAFLRSFLPKFSRVLGGASISAVVAGILLFGYISTVPTPITPSGWETIFALLGGVLGLIATLLTLAVAVPLASRFMDPASQRENGPKYTVLDEASIIGGLNSVMRAVVVILLFAFALMMMGAYA